MGMGGMGMGGTGGWSPPWVSDGGEAMPDAEAWLAKCDVDDKAANQFRGMPPPLQWAVMKKGSLQDARDQTAVLIARMRNVAVGAEAGAPAATSGGCDPTEGDWQCPFCQDIQFRRNMACRMCGCPKAVAGMKGAKAKGMMGKGGMGEGWGKGGWGDWGGADGMAGWSAPPWGSGSGWSADPDTWLAMHPGVDPKAAQQFRVMAPSLQQEVMKKGSLLGARDQTAVLITRMKQVVMGSNANGSMDAAALKQQGDWTCPKCGDLQFARNAVCRMCGIPRPVTDAANADPPAAFNAAPTDFAAV